VCNLIAAKSILIQKVCFGTNSIRENKLLYQYAISYSFFFYYFEFLMIKLIFFIVLTLFFQLNQLKILRQPRLLTFLS